MACRWMLASWLLCERRLICFSSLLPSPADNEDFSLAFQVLETARVIYARHYTGPGRVHEVRAEDDKPEEEKSDASSAAAAAAAPAAASASAASASAASAAAAAPSSSAAASDAEPSLSQKDLGLGLAYTYELLAQWFLEKGQCSAVAVCNCRCLLSNADCYVRSAFLRCSQRISPPRTVRTARLWTSPSPGSPLTRAMCRPFI